MPMQLQICKGCGGTDWYDNNNDNEDWSLCWDCIRETMQLPPDVRNRGKGGAGGTPNVHAEIVRSPGYGSKLPHHSNQYVVERGSGSSGTAYNKRDYEVIDLERKPGNRIVARASCLDAELICRALNAFGRE